MEGATEQSDLDYLLGVAVSQPAPAQSAPPLAPTDVRRAAVAPLSGVVPVPPTSVPTAPQVPVVAPSATVPVPVSVAPVPTATATDAVTPPHNPKKRPLEEKKARDRKRVLRNRELARVSNERRKGRIKAMENELSETRKTVTTLEESIRCLEAENNELRNLLQGKPTGGATSGAAASAPLQTDGGTATGVTAATASPTATRLPPQ